MLSLGHVTLFGMRFAFVNVLALKHFLECSRIPLALSQHVFFVMTCTLSITYLAIDC